MIIVPLNRLTVRLIKYHSEHWGITYCTTHMRRVSERRRPMAYPECFEVGWVGDITAMVFWGSYLVLYSYDIPSPRVGVWWKFTQLTPLYRDPGCRLSPSHSLYLPLPILPHILYGPDGLSVWHGSYTFVRHPSKHKNVQQLNRESSHTRQRSRSLVEFIELGLVHVLSNTRQVLELSYWLPVDRYTVY